MRRKKRNYKYIVKKHTSRVLLILKLLAVFSVLAVLVHFSLFSGYFNILHVAIYGTDRFVNSSDMLQMANENLLNRNIFLIKTEEVKDKLTKTFLGAKKVEIKRNLPKTIDIHVTERVPIAIVYQKPEEKFLVDIDGYVLGYTSLENEELPQIHYKKDISVGLFIDKDLVPMYTELTDLLNTENIRVSSMSFNEKHVNFILDNGEEVLVGLQKNKNEVVQAISALLKEAELKSKSIKRIDLRYDKVIVLFN